MSSLICGTQAFYSTFHLASLCGVNVETVRRAIKSGILPARETRSDEGIQRRQYEIMAGDVLPWRLGPGWETVVEGAAEKHR